MPDQIDSNEHNLPVGQKLEILPMAERIFRRISKSRSTVRPFKAQGNGEPKIRQVNANESLSSDVENRAKPIESFVTNVVFIHQKIKFVFAPVAATGLIERKRQDGLFAASKAMCCCDNLLCFCGELQFIPVVAVKSQLTFNFALTVLPFAVV